MSTLSNVRLPKPKDWQTFERLTRLLFEFVLADPNTAMHGRVGQPQHGVDIYGYRNRDPTRLVGVQCKLSDDEITEAELHDEFEKAKKFKPAICEFVLTTTAPRDGKIQKVARQLTEQLADSDRPIFVQVWGWHDIEDRASKYAEVWNAFDPTFNPYAERAHQELSLRLESIERKVQSIDVAITPDRASASSI